MVENAGERRESLLTYVLAKPTRHIPTESKWLWHTGSSGHRRRVASDKDQSWIRNKVYVEKQNKNKKTCSLAKKQTNMRIQN